MRSFWIMLAAIATIAGAPSALAQATHRLAPGAESPAASIDQLGWLAGEWVGEGLGARTVEVYSRPSAGQIAGHFVLHDDSGVRFYELLQIAPVGETLVYRLRHFNPDLSGWEDETGAPVEFRLVAIAADAVHFDGLSLVRDGPDRLTVTVRIGGDSGTQDAVFRYRRAP